MTTVAQAGATGAKVEPQFLVRERERVDEALREIVAQRVPRVVERLGGPVAYALSGPGKRIRPVLCVAAYRVATGAQAVDPAVYRLSCALEIVHTYSLIHDDLPCMDDDDLRRGRPTLHRVFDNGVAIVAGAALLPLAVDVLDGSAADLGLSGDERATLVTELTVAVGPAGMVGGQLLDLQAESRRVDGDELERIHAAKTGALVAASLRIGALAGRAGEDLLRALTEYGQALGLAFQIADDLLDVEGSSGTLGKTAGRDRELEKASYPSLYGVERAKEMAHEQAEMARRAIGGLGLTDLEELADYVVTRRK